MPQTNTFAVSREVEPTFRAIWADNKSFDEVLISKRMVQDHMPDNVMDAFDKVTLRSWLIRYRYLEYN